MRSSKVIVFGGLHFSGIFLCCGLLAETVSAEETAQMAPKNTPDTVSLFQKAPDRGFDGYILPSAAWVQLSGYGTEAPEATEVRVEFGRTRVHFAADLRVQNRREFLGLGGSLRTFMNTALSTEIFMNVGMGVGTLYGTGLPTSTQPFLEALANPFLRFLYKGTRSIGMSLEVGYHAIPGRFFLPQAQQAAHRDARFKSQWYVSLGIPFVAD